MAKSLVLSGSDVEQFAALRAAHVLREINPGQIESLNGTIIVGCSDGDKFREFYDHHCVACEGAIRHHALCLNGGALLLSKHSPVPHAKSDGETLLRHIKAARDIKNIKSCALYVHAPCGVAGQAGLDIIEVVRLLMEAKLRLKQQRNCSDLKFHCFMHVTHPDKGNRTYFVQRQVALSFLRDQGRATRS